MHVFLRSAQKLLRKQLAVHQSLCNTLRTNTGTWIAHAISIHTHTTRSGSSREETSLCSTQTKKYISDSDETRQRPFIEYLQREYIVQYKTNNPQRSSRMPLHHIYFSLNGVSVRLLCENVYTLPKPAIKFDSA